MSCERKAEQFGSWAGGSQSSQQMEDIGGGFAFLSKYVGVVLRELPIK